MKIIVFGATGSVGRHIVSQALEQGHEVTAFARRPQALKIEHGRLNLISGNVYDSSAVEAAIEGQDAVLVTLGSPKLTGNLRSKGTLNIINAMKLHKVERLICQSTLGAGDSIDNLNFKWRYLLFGVLLRFVMKDHQLQEGFVRKSGLEWTIIRPSAFTDEKGTKGYKVGFSPALKGLALKIPRVEVAQVMLSNLTSKSYLYKSPGLSY